MQTYTFQITNLNCEACAKVSAHTLKKLPGVTDAKVDFTTGAAEVNSEQSITSAEIETVLNEKGYKVIFSSNV